MVGHGEGELVDDNAGELLALYVHSLPEGRGAEEDGVGGIAELLQEDVARGRAVQEQRVGQLGEEAMFGGDADRVNTGLGRISNAVESELKKQEPVGAGR